ncbi:hypothetical protein JB92DRAFT_2832656 [Gautieria morchelliformis]|nr:hypothetical protein JB92DRAFT_2832656 [Gautieria morchelliformis]
MQNRRWCRGKGTPLSGKGGNHLAIGLPGMDPTGAWEGRGEGKGDNPKRDKGGHGQAQTTLAHNRKECQCLEGGLGKETAHRSEDGDRQECKDVDLKPFVTREQQNLTKWVPEGPTGIR